MKVIEKQIIQGKGRCKASGVWLTSSVWMGQLRVVDNTND
jgi:hypothetical protein